MPDYGFPDMSMFGSFGALSGQAPDLGYDPTSFVSAAPPPGYQMPQAQQSQQQQGGFSSIFGKIVSGALLGMAGGAGAPDIGTAFSSGYMAVMQQKERERQMILEQQKMQQQQYLLDSQVASNIADRLYREKQTELLDDDLAIKYRENDLRELQMMLTATNGKYLGVADDTAEGRQSLLNAAKQVSGGRINWLPSGDGQKVYAFAPEAVIPEGQVLQLGNNDHSIEIPVGGMSILDASKLKLEWELKELDRDARIQEQRIATSGTIQAAQIQAQSWLNRLAAQPNTKENALLKENLDAANQRLNKLYEQLPMQQGETEKMYEKRVSTVRNLITQTQTEISALMGNAAPATQYKIGDVVTDPKTGRQGKITGRDASGNWVLSPVTATAPADDQSSLMQKGLIPALVEGAPGLAKGVANMSVKAAQAPGQLLFGSKNIPSIGMPSIPSIPSGAGDVAKSVFQAPGNALQAVGQPNNDPFLYDPALSRLQDAIRTGDRDAVLAAAGQWQEQTGLSWPAVVNFLLQNGVAPELLGQ